MTDAPGHVLFLNWRDTRHPEGGGSEVYIERMASEFVTLGHRATLFCQAHPHAPAEEVTPTGVRIIRRGGRHTVYLRAALAYLAGALGVGPLARRRPAGRPTVLVDVGNGLPFLSRLYARRRVIVLVHHVHREQWSVVLGPWLARIGWWIESRLAVRVYRGCQYVTVSQATRSELIGLGVDADRIAVIHNGAPASARTARPRSAHPSMVVLGRLVPHKRVQIALRATMLLAAELPTLELVVAGQGWWDEPLRRLAADLGIEQRVRFTGHVDEDRKRDLLSTAWLALMPSLKEGWGLTIVEAAAVGTPTVAFRSAGGVTEAIVDGETGVLVGDEEEFVTAIRSLLLDAGRRAAMGAAAQLHARRFTWAESAAAFAALLGTHRTPPPRRSVESTQRLP